MLRILLHLVNDRFVSILSQIVTKFKAVVWLQLKSDKLKTSGITSLCPYNGGNLHKTFWLSI